jgi:hypothetical protein
MISWLIGLVTGMIYACVGIASRLKLEDEARKLKARWARALGVGFYAPYPQIKVHLT